MASKAVAMTGAKGGGVPPAFFDTTILIYSISLGEHRAAVAEKLLAEGGWISVQVLNEFPVDRYTTVEEPR